MDPRQRVHAASHEILSQLAASLTEHWGWLEDHLDEVHSEASRRRKRRAGVPLADKTNADSGAR